MNTRASSAKMATCAMKAPKLRRELPYALSILTALLALSPVALLPPTHSFKVLFQQMSASNAPLESTAPTTVSASKTVQLATTAQENY